ncbi:MAG: alkaline phosphatase [Planctomycetes bacterium]|nr:alkaline phosphatase [Planctomycetota bacterium]
MTIDRRTFLGAAGLTAAIPVLSGLPAARADQAPAEEPRRAAKNLVFMVADGMSFGTLSLGDMVLQLRDGSRAHWVGLMNRAGTRRGLVETRSADGFVTDSAAASTAWGIGELVDNGRVGMTPDGRFPTPILIHAKQAGKAGGLVTTTRVTHATPAGFSCNVPTNRDDESRIAAQMLERRIDLMVGGGARFFPDSLLAKHPDVEVIRTRSQFDAFAGGAVGTGPLLGLFAGSHVPFEVDRRTLSLPVPSLAEMSRAALARLERAGGDAGFVLQIEGGRVDHAGHYNDAAGLIDDMIAFDAAVGAVIEWAANRDDTLVIVTADHATANPGLTEYGARGVKGLMKTLKFRHSFEWMEGKLASKFPLANPEPPEFGDGDMAHATGIDINPADLRDIIEEATGIALSKGETELLARWKRGEAVDGFALAGARYGPLGAVMANHTFVAFLSPNHTSDPVEITAFGPGSELIAPWQQINRVHAALVKALDLPPAKPVA